LCRRRHKHQLRHAHAIELLHEGIPLPLIQRQLGHSHLSTTGTCLQGIDTEEIISTVHARLAPMMHASAGLACSHTAGAHHALPHARARLLARASSSQASALLVDQRGSVVRCRELFRRARRSRSRNSIGHGSVLRRWTAAEPPERTCPDPT
jgi:Phage integrase family